MYALKFGSWLGLLWAFLGVLGCAAIYRSVRSRREPAGAGGSRAGGSSDAGALPAPTIRGRERGAGWLQLGVCLIALSSLAAYLALVRTPASEQGRDKVALPSVVAPVPPDRTNAVGALSDDQLQRMIDHAAAQVKSNPSDAAAWAMLAHSSEMLGKFAEASKAYGQLVALRPNDAQVLADYADALAVTNGRQFKGQPAAMIAKALALDDKNEKALILAGSEAIERQSFEEAVGYWEAASRVTADPSVKAKIASSIQDARAAARGDAMRSTPIAVPGRAASAGSVSGRVILADDLAAKAAPDSTVFVFARPVSGSRMPVAILKRKVSDLPADFVLDDSNSMTEAVKLSTLATVVIGARISRQGDVMPQAGDMQGWSAPVSVGARGVRLEISEVLK